MALSRTTFLRGLLALAAASCGPSSKGAPARLINASYDPTRELYAEINTAFTAQWASTHAAGLIVEMSNAGSGHQARAVIDGMPADVATLATPYDVDQIAKAGLIDEDWRERLPYRSAPFTSTIVFLVRADNPKGIRDWSDLTQAGLSVVTPNPKTSGGARWNYLAAWAYALSKNNNVQAAAREFVARLYANVSVLDSGARAATTTFVQRGIGDVLITWENEAFLAKREAGADVLTIVTPSLSILAEPPVAWIDRNIDRRGTRDAAEAYLHFLYTPQGQEIGARHFLRPSDPAVLVQHPEFASIPLVSVDDIFGGWAAAQQLHFADGAIFDQIMGGRRA